jgi:branched-chain amino acid transport system substrate-binding protein
MSRRSSIASLTVAVGLLASACSSGSPSDNGSSGSCDANGKIVVGEARAETGDYAFFDGVAMNGNLLAIDQINKSGGLLGCQLTVIDGDTKGDPALGGRVADGLIQKGAKILFSPSDFDVGIAAAQAGEKAGLVGTSEASAVNMPDAVGPHFFAAGITDEGVGLAEAVFANEKGWKHAYVVTNEQFSVFTNIEKFFKSKFNGDVVARDVVADTQTDYSAIVSKIAAQKQADVIFLNDYFPHVGTFIKQLRDAGIETPVLGGSSYSSPDFPGVVGPTRMSQVYYASPVFYEGTKGLDPDVAKIIDAYKAKFGKTPENNNFMEGYDSALLLLDGVKAAGTLDADKVAAAINAEANVDLPGATLTKWVDRHTQRTLVIIGFDDQGSFIQVKAPFDPETAG